MREEGIELKNYGIRLDSGDLAYLSKKARKMLDCRWLLGCIHLGSNDLDEYLILDLKNQGAAITSWGVGTSMITSKDCPAFGGVYKLAAIQNATVNLFRRSNSQKIRKRLRTQEIKPFTESMTKKPESFLLT